MPINQPIPLPPNFVWRSYLGGSRLRRLRLGRDGGPDDHFPEDWLASSVSARNPGRDDSREGLSRVDWEGAERLWPDFVAENADVLLGEGRGSFGALVKLLDSSVRLHLQAHPSRAFARKKLGSDFGKTECWYVLATRSPSAHVYLGFQRPPEPKEWLNKIQEQDVPGMLACFDKLPVRPGDCLVVPAGVPHAIGEGVFMIELQEPSDWVVRCEWEAGGYVLPEAARWMGLAPEECVDLFDYTRYGPAEIDGAFRQVPRRIGGTNEWIHEEAIAPRWHSFFRLERFRGRGAASWRGGEGAIAIVLEGRGTLGGAGMEAGQTFFLPAACREWTWRPEDGTEWEILLALPPVP